MARKATAICGYTHGFHYIYWGCWVFVHSCTERRHFKGKHTKPPHSTNVSLCKRSIEMHVMYRVCNYLFLSCVHALYLLGAPSHLLENPHSGHLAEQQPFLTVESPVNTAHLPADRRTTGKKKENARHGCIRCMTSLPSHDRTNIDGQDVANKFVCRMVVVVLLGAQNELAHCWFTCRMRR